MDVAATARREAAKAQAAKTEAEAATEQTRAYAENAVGELKQRVSLHRTADKLVLRMKANVLPTIAYMVLQAHVRRYQ